MKIEIMSSNNRGNLQIDVNRFMKDKKIIDVRVQTQVKFAHSMADNTVTRYTTTILYE